MAKANSVEAEIDEMLNAFQYCIETIDTAWKDAKYSGPETKVDIYLLYERARKDYRRQILSVVAHHMKPINDNMKLGCTVSLQTAIINALKNSRSDGDV